MTAAPEISAHALAQLERCERLFELVHVRRAVWPGPDPAGSPELAGRLRVGTAFHRMAQLAADGLPVEPVLATCQGSDEADLRAMWGRFAAAGLAAPAGRVLSEQTLRVRVAGVRLVVRFDRLSEEPGGYTIWDWKTGSRFDPVAAAGAWQTRLYRLALAAGGAYFTGGEAIAPERIQVAYWHATSGATHRFAYDEALLRDDVARLEAVAGRLEAALAAGFTPNANACGRCRFDTRCRLGHGPGGAPAPSAEPRPPRFVFPAL